MQDQIVIFIGGIIYGILAIKVYNYCLAKYTKYKATQYVKNYFANRHDTY
jgi:uncharacterized membrane protein required for colicin V production